MQSKVTASVIMLFLLLGMNPKVYSAEIQTLWHGDVGAGDAYNQVHLYSNGTLIHNMSAHSSSKVKGVRAGTFVVGVDASGRAIFVSNYQQIPTACSSMDFCPTTSHGQAIDHIDPALAEITARLDVYVGDRDNGSVQRSFNAILRDLKAMCGSLPDIAKSKLGC